MNYKAPDNIPEGYEWVIVEDPRTIFRGFMRKTVYINSYLWYN